MLGTQELIVILLIVVFVFGAKRIPEIMGGLGEGIRTFKKSMEEREEPTPEKPSQSGSMSRTGEANEPSDSGSNRTGSS